MILNDIWFVLFVVVIAGYLILDGFDMGVGILHMLVARDDDDRRTLLNSIGPVWDSNEVWLILGGGALFAAFPMVYASLFSGFYTAMMLVLLVMILRTVAIEFRGKRATPGWRTFWDVVFAATSFGLATLLGVAFGNIVSGLPIDAAGDMRIDLFGLLGPYAVLLGLATVSMLTMHGALFLTMKTEGDLNGRVRRAATVLMVGTTVLMGLVVVATLVFRQHLLDRYLNDIWPLIFPAGAVAALATAWRMTSIGQSFKAFVASAVMIGLVLVTAATGMFPNLLISSIDPQFNLTIYNGASESNTLGAMLIIAVIGMPLVLMYTASVYFIFRGKTRVDRRGY
jgi:cytochrome bd ubiquinol oxidase subunit II